MADLEYVWRSRTTQSTKNLALRASRYRRLARELLTAPHALSACNGHKRVTLLRAAEWADHRARATAMTRADVVATCDERWRQIACGCGTRELQVGCDQPMLCMKCRKRHSAKWRSKITAGMDAALRHERAAWYATPAYRRRGMKPGIYLITLTGPHSGDLGTDRERMGEAVRALLKHANKRKWWSTYALTWEATSGPTKLAPERERNEAHLHVHLAVISSWVPYSSKQARNNFEAWDHERRETFGRVGVSRIGVARRRSYARHRERGLHEVWRDAMHRDGMPDAEVLDVQAPRNGADGAYNAGEYLAKYVTKGVEPTEFTGRKAGELLVAFRSRRKVSTSAGFWTPAIKTCECCGHLWRSMGAPMSLQELSPGAVMRSLSERTRYRDGDRFNAQVPLRSADERPLVTAVRISVSNIRKRADRRNSRRSPWSLRNGPSTWAEPVELVGWKPQHFDPKAK